ncbi:MAG: triose-phosphate isomerase [Planctomycetes bacterium]|nr:triose-phosphate isomerase [Planctomycetota bacterium]
MNLRRQSACELVSALKAEGRKCWLFPAFPLLGPVADTLIGGGLRLGAQDVSPEPDGAFTGDVSAEMLVDAGCELVLVGHSERRKQHGELGDLLARKLKRAAEGGLETVYCVGETLNQRKAGKAREVVKEHLSTLQGARKVAAVAYEPVWAIGTGETATPAQAEEMHAFIRGELKTLGLDVPILYGGSVKPGNARELLAQAHVDGVLVGGASLKLESLRAIDEAALES